MLGDVVRRAGEGVGGAVAGPSEGLAGEGLGILLGPWGIIGVVFLFLLLRAIR